jgi:hypothetical protein
MSMDRSGRLVAKHCSRSCHIWLRTPSSRRRRDLPEFVHTRQQGLFWTYTGLWPHPIGFGLGRAGVSHPERYFHSVDARLPQS